MPDQVIVAIVALVSAAIGTAISPFGQDFVNRRQHARIHRTVERVETQVQAASRRTIDESAYGHQFLPLREEVEQAVGQ